jgi:hypothetical protein
MANEVDQEAPMMDATPIRSEMVRYIPGEALAVTREPEEVLADAQKAAAALMKVVKSKKKQIVFNGETYLESGDWQTVAKFYGVTAKIESTRFVQFGEAQGFEAAAVALDCNGREVSRGEAMCLNDEENWGMRPQYEWEDVLDGQGKKIWEYNAAKGKDLPKRKKVKVGEIATPLFQLRSMAQTRACAKALSNLFKWVVVLAGYKPTPAEEMTGTVEEGTEPIQSATGTTTTQPSSASGGAAPNGTTEGSAISHNAPEPDIRPRSQRGAQPSPQAPAASPEPSQGQGGAVQGEVVTSEPTITGPQSKRFFAIMRSADLSEGECKARLAKLGYHGHRDGIPKRLYEAAVDAIDPQMRFHQNKPK